MVCQLRAKYTVKNHSYFGLHNIIIITIVTAVCVQGGPHIFFFFFERIFFLFLCIKGCIKLCATHTLMHKIKKVFGGPPCSPTAVLILLLLFRFIAIIMKIDSLIFFDRWISPIR